MRDPRNHNAPKVKVAVRQDAISPVQSVIGLVLLVVVLIVLIGAMSGT